MVSPPEPPKIVVQPTTAQRISEALRNGEINAEQALVYEVYDAFHDARLPDRFHGDDDRRIDSDISYDALSHFDSLSPAAQAAIAPFFIPPFQRGSWASPVVGTLAVPAPAFVNLCGQVNTTDWDFRETSDRKIRVWFQKKNAATDSTTATIMASELDVRMIPALQQLMDQSPPADSGASLPCRGDSDALDIALVDARSQTIPYSRCIGGSGTSFILLDRGKGLRTIVPTAGHEVMHAMQLMMMPDNCSTPPRYRWIMEATAQWAMDYFYPSKTDLFGNAEQEFDHPGWFLKDPGKPLEYLDPNDDSHAYSAYILPFLIHRLYGDALFARRVFQNIRPETLDSVDLALQQEGGLEKIWPRFALYNWNREPVRNYNDLDGIANSAKTQESAGYPPGDTPLPIELRGNANGSGEFLIDLEHLSAEYHRLVFSDPAVRSVAFYNGLTFDIKKEKYFSSDQGVFPATTYIVHDLDASKKKGANVQAITKINGKWQKPEDWTDKAVAFFCLDKADERLEELILIFSSSDRDTSARLTTTGRQAPLLTWSNLGCFEWRGTVKFSDTNEGGTSTLSTQDVVFRRADWPGNSPQMKNGSSLIRYVLAQGEVTSSVKSTPNCTYRSSGPLQVPATPDFANFLNVFNFAVNGDTYYRRYLGLGTDSHQVPAATSGPDCGAPLDVFGSWLLTSFDAPSQVDATGGTLKGTYNPGPGVVWEWNLTAAREP